MHAHVGDWLVVKSRTETRHARRAEIVDVPAADGSPPYTVRWLDDGREVLVFPGPDAEVVTAERLAEIDRAQAGRIAEVRSAISAEREHR